ncbi:hypothetical protein HPB47_018410 [Ixodes persulcatus]|uniref:Uncharacterized protein n=1 Tax=Ixodes persulcatus TaxID=34615 RepID=A0AC60QMS1_IXOPE|nr:hypothetical protein HPB47_018410 [Ixodes persulcatus]
MVYAGAKGKSEAELSTALSHTAAGLPSRESTLESYKKILAKQETDHNGSLKETIVMIQLLKFDLETAYSLVPALKKLGVGSIFSAADQSAITGDRALVVTEVQYKAAIEVNEEGTVAAAATVVAANRG